MLHGRSQMSESDRDVSEQKWNRACHAFSLDSTRGKYLVIVPFLQTILSHSFDKLSTRVLGSLSALAKTRILSGSLHSDPQYKLGTWMTDARHMTSCAF